MPTDPCNVTYAHHAHTWLRGTERSISDAPECPGVTEPDPITTIDTPSLRRMAERAYRDAARSWSEYRAADGCNDACRAARAILRESAVSADAYWHTLRDTLALRED